MKSRAKYLIIGAGPTGLGAAYRLRDLGEHDFLIVDAAGHVGGLAASFTDERGFVWDVGGHVQFSHYQYFDEAMERAIPKRDWLEHERESWVWMKDRFVPYPFQNNIRYLPQADMLACLRGVFAAAKESSGVPLNFREWILKVFGAGIADLFMLPYNFKVWAYPPELLSYSWIGERVATIDVQRIVENVILERDDVSWGPNNTFKFPLRGGTGSIWRSISEIVGLDRIKLGMPLVRINPSRQIAHFANGTQVSYNHLLSTIPLDRLAQLVDELPQELKQEALGLKHSASNIIGVGLKGRPAEDVKKKCWMYFPEDDCPFYRVTLFSNYSPNNVPDISRYYSLMCEVSESEHKPVNQDTLVGDTISGLRNTRLINETDEISSVWTYRADYGYPTPSLTRDIILGALVPELDRLGVYSRGRFGGWKYEVSNQDHSFMQGAEWVDLIKLGKPETTYVVKCIEAHSPTRARKSAGASRLRGSAAYRTESSSAGEVE